MADVTLLLDAAAAGDRKAAADLLPLVYDELRKLAAARMADEVSDQTLQATALVHEAYLRLVGPADEARWDNCGHFVAAAAEAMRRILVDAARRKRTEKHGGHRHRVELPDLPANPEVVDEPLLALDAALTRLAAEDAVAAWVVELRHVAGLSIDDAATALGLSRAACLDRACGGDAGLRDRVEALLRSHDPDGSFLRSPAVKPPEPNGATQALGVDPCATQVDGENDAEDLQFLAPAGRPDSRGRIGHYEVLQVLGNGGFGIVFRAFDDVLQRVVAVKVMAPQRAATSPARRRFLREARSSSAVRHENVVQVYEVGEQPLPYLVMEFIPGETLRQRLDRVGPLEVPEVLRIGRQVAEWLAAAHACDLIHRDIKPGNILLEGGSHKAKITDFGLARAADDASIAQSGIIVGTPMFMSPEQALGYHVDRRADLFSLGSVLYEMVSGRPPFRAPSALAVLNRVAEEAPRPIPEIIRETPDWLCGIISKLHAKDPNNRFQSAREVANLLADCEAKLKAKQPIRNVLHAARAATPAASAGRKRLAAAAVVLLPVIALAVTDIAPIRVFNALRVLDCGGTAANSESTAQLADLPLEGMNLAGLTHLTLGYTRVSDAGLAHFQGCKNLVGLHLHTTPVGDAGVAHFKDCKNLHALGLSDTKVTDAGLAHFKDCKNLEPLNLSGKQVTDAGLAHFSDCKSLKSLHLLGTQVSDAGLVHFEGCKEPTTLSLTGTKVSDAGLAHFKDCRSLADLRLSGTRVSEAGLENLKGMPLKKLYIAGTDVTDLKPLQGMALEDIRLTSRYIAQGLNILRDTKSLKTIGIEYGDNGWPAAEFWERYDKGEFTQ